MYDFEDYYTTEEDEIIDQALETIKNNIINRAKEAFDEVKNEAENLRNDCKKMKAERDAAIEERCKLECKNAELQAIINNVPKFRLDQTAYVLKMYPWCYNAEAVVCPTCNGEGKITLKATDYGDITIECPDCHNLEYSLPASRGQKYLKRVPIEKYQPTKIKIEGIRKNKSSTMIYIDSETDEWRESEIFVSKEEAEAACEERNKNAYEVAMKKLHKEPV